MYTSSFGCLVKHIRSVIRPLDLGDATKWIMMKFGLEEYNFMKIFKQIVDKWLG